MTNSRPQKRRRQTWRRRQCERCGAIFSTIESADLTASMRVRFADGTLQSFERDKLFLSVVTALGHRRDAVSAATALTATIIAKLLQTVQEASVRRETICAIAADTLESFDSAAAVQYGAYHMQ